MGYVDFNAQYRPDAPGRKTLGNIDLDKRVPYFPEGLNAAGMSIFQDNVPAELGLGNIGEGTHTKTEESATIPTDANGVPFRGKVAPDHKYWANIPTVLHGSQRANTPQDPHRLEKDAVMNYMLTGKHLGQYDQGMGLAVEDAVMTHLRQANDTRDLPVSPELMSKMNYAGEMTPKSTKELLNAKGDK